MYSTARSYRGDLYFARKPNKLDNVQQCTWNLRPSIFYSVIVLVSGITIYFDCQSLSKV